MKQELDLKVRSSRYLKKMLRDLKLLILVVLLGSSNVLMGADQQQRVVTGTVTDASNGALMPGVNIIVRGTTIGALTDINGKYSLTVPDAASAILGFSFIGYDAQDVAVSGRSVVDVALSPSTTSLDEVIVIGYGTQKKSDLTGSVARVSMDEKATLANMNLSQAMAGTTAGVNVTGVGLAGGDPSLSIRGQTSLSASDAPLIVLDGIIYNGSITNINVSDIESVDILKDASAAAVYGSRSANGVMLITTKKGKTEKPVIAFNMYYGYQDMTNNPMRVMNTQEYAVRLVDYYYQQDLYAWYKTKPTSATGKPVRPDINNRELVAARLRTQEEREIGRAHV